MKLGANSVLFGGSDLKTAFEQIARAGYDGIEVSAIDGMSDHLALDRWQEIGPDIKRWSAEYGLELLAMEQPSQAAARMETAFQAASDLGIPSSTAGRTAKAAMRPLSSSPSTRSALWREWPRSTASRFVSRRTSARPLITPRPPCA